MKLIEVRVQKFRNIIDSEPVSIQPDVTCLVGKNESGKTAFLDALYRLRPKRQNSTFSVCDQYPAWLEKRDRLNGEDLEKMQPISACFEVEDRDVEVLQSTFGWDVLSSRRVCLAKAYNGALSWAMETDEAAFVRHVLGVVQLPQGAEVRVGHLQTIRGLWDFIGQLKAGSARSGERVMGQEVGDDLEAYLKEALGDGDLAQAVGRSLEPLVPTFMYFSEFSRLPYSVEIHRVLTADPATLEDGELTARSLLRLAAASDDYLAAPNYERRRRELENVANALTDDVLTYWSQNRELRVQPDITQRTESTPEGTLTVLDEFKIRIWDQRHLLSLPFDQHSSGFRWFFSFLAAFSEYEHTAEPLVILLDEPALGLHARAQRDFLRFIDERLSPRCQVIYTTHSPFMIPSSKIERVRLIEDQGVERGAKTSVDLTSSDPDTLFPLQGAIGYDLVQDLLTAPHNLVVEGTSDFTYLTVLSDYLRELPGRTPLDEHWSIVPVGGSHIVPAFVALLGHHLDVTVLVDARKRAQRKLSGLANQGILRANRIVSLGQVIGAKLAGIEDVFEPTDYLMLYNRSFDRSWNVTDLDGAGPIVGQIARREGIEPFDHGRPAEELLRHRGEILPQLSVETLDRFDALFKVLNATQSM